MKSASSLSSSVTIAAPGCTAIVPRADIMFFQVLDTAPTKKKGIVVQKPKRGGFPVQVQYFLPEEVMGRSEAYPLEECFLL